jgi:hypothetical protein
LRGALVTLAIVAAVGTPFWFADTVLGHRYDLGLGGGGPRLGSPGSVLHYLWLVAGDFSAGTHRWLTPVLVLAAIGFIALLRARRTSALLALCVIVVPAVALMLAKLSSNASPESRHLIFALPFFSTLIASGLVAIGRMRAPLAPLLAVVGIAMLVVGEVRWADAKTPALFHGDPPARAAARNAAASWLASTSRPNDVLFGYEPLYLAAWERDRSFSKHALPRADPKLLANKLRRLPAPLGRGVWVLDADDSTDVTRSLTIPLLLPQPEASFEARTFGPYLVIRSRAPLQTPERYLAAAKSVERLGTTLKIGDASINLYALALAQQQLYGSSSRSRSSSRSTISR